MYFGGDLWICLTIASFVSFRIAPWARTSILLYSSPLSAHAFCNSIFIPLTSSSPPVASSCSAPLARRWNLFQYYVTDCLPFLIFLSLILASPLRSMRPNWLFCSLLNPPHVFQVVVIRSSTYGVIQVAALSFRRLVAYRVFSSSWLSCHPTVW